MATHVLPLCCNAAATSPGALFRHASPLQNIAQGHRSPVQNSSLCLGSIAPDGRNFSLGLSGEFGGGASGLGAKERPRVLDVVKELRGTSSAARNGSFDRNAAELGTGTRPRASRLSGEVNIDEKNFTRKFDYEQRSVGNGAKVRTDPERQRYRGRNVRHDFGTKRSKEKVFLRGDRLQTNSDDEQLLERGSDLGCEFFSRCSGCSIDNALDRPPVIKDTTKFFKDHGIKEFTFTSGNVWEWRCRAKLAVRGTAENPLIGLYEEGSHTVVDIPSCRAHHPHINTAVQYVKEAIKELAIEPYDEETETGCLRYIQMVISTYNTSIPASERYANSRVQVTLVWNARDENAPQAKLLQPMAEYMWKKGGAKSSTPILHSVWANFQTSRSNTIFGGKWRHLLGDREMWERIAGADICFSPGSFGQANTQAFDALLRKLQTFVKRGSAVVELYAGVGAIGMSLAATRACRSVKCVEVNKEAKISFQTSLSRLPGSIDSHISWHCADASVSTIRWLDGSDVVVVDPPRKGLEPSVVEALRTAAFRGQGKVKSASAHVTSRVEKRPWVIRANQGVIRDNSIRQPEDGESSWPDTLIYVSCGWESFKQDCLALIKDNAWNLDDAHAFNFFPGTDSIEVLAIFKRGRKMKRKEKKR